MKEYLLSEKMHYFHLFRNPVYPFPIQLVPVHSRELYARVKQAEFELHVLSQLDRLFVVAQSFRIFLKTSSILADFLSVRKPHEIIFQREDLGQLA